MEMDIKTVLAVITALMTILAAFFGKNWMTIKAKLDKVEGDVANVTEESGKLLIPMSAMMKAWTAGTPPTQAQLADMMAQISDLMTTLNSLGPDTADLLAELQKDFMAAMQNQGQITNLQGRIDQLEAIIKAAAATCATPAH